MTAEDDAILEFLADLGEPLGERVGVPPLVVHHYLSDVLGQTDKSHSTIQRRMRLLADVGLIRRLDDHAFYEITDMGLRYLNEDLTDDEREQLRDK
jgi:DNA-binding transcriptional ArsR family regulator